MIELDNLLDELDNSRAQFLMAIEMLPDEALIVPAAVGDWAIADVLANLTAWDAELVTGFLHLRQGKRPERLLAALANPAAFDAQCYAENQERDLDQIFDDWQQVRVKLEEWLEEMPLRDLTNPQRYKALAGKSLWQVIQTATIRRETAYLSAVAAFAAQWRPPEPIFPELVTPLTAVSPLETPPHDPDSHNPNPA